MARILHLIPMTDLVENLATDLDHLMRSKLGEMSQPWSRSEVKSRVSSLSLTLTYVSIRSERCGTK